MLQKAGIFISADKLTKNARGMGFMDMRFLSLDLLPKQSL
jgi:hypothetical protein